MTRLAVDEELGAGGPLGNAEVEGERWRGGRGVDAECGRCRLRGRYGSWVRASCALRAVQRRVEGQKVDRDGRVVVGAEEVGVDAVVGGELREGAGAAGPAVGGVDAVAVACSRRSRRSGRRPEGTGAECGVQHDALHGISVVAVAGGLEEIAGELHVGVGSRRGFRRSCGSR